MLEAGYEYVGNDAKKPVSKESEGYAGFAEELEAHAADMKNAVIKEAAKIVVKEGVKAVEKELDTDWGKH
jgi:predicted ATP-dependent protease